LIAKSVALDLSIKKLTIWSSCLEYDSKVLSRPSASPKTY
jgi:hypothetical protein